MSAEGDHPFPVMPTPVQDQATGITREAQIFVGAQGASHLMFVMATWTQTLPD